MSNDDRKPSEDEVPPDDTTATTPLGVGESMSKSGEDVETKGSGDRDRDTEAKGDGAGPPSEEKTGIDP